MDELTRLKKENEELKRILREYGYIYVDEHLLLNKEERLDIFMDYFKGRNDVYASQYYSKKNNRYEYSFVCENKFKKDVCPIINKKKCNADCHMNAILIDEKEVWTSSASYFGIQNQDLFYMKIDDENIIEELKLFISN